MSKAEEENPMPNPEKKQINTEAGKKDSIDDILKDVESLLRSDNPSEANPAPNSEKPDSDSDWLGQLKRNQGRPQDEKEGSGGLSFSEYLSENPGSIFSTAAETKSPDQAGSAAADEDYGLPDWLKGSSTSELPEGRVSASNDDTPDWLKGLAEASARANSNPDGEGGKGEVVAESSADENGNNWFTSWDSEDNSLDWLKSSATPTAPTTAPTTPASEPQTVAQSEVKAESSATEDSNTWLRNLLKDEVFPTATTENPTVASEPVVVKGDVLSFGDARKELARNREESAVPQEAASPQVQKTAEELLKEEAEEKTKLALMAAEAKQIADERIDAKMNEKINRNEQLDAEKNRPVEEEEARKRAEKIENARILENNKRVAVEWQRDLNSGQSEAAKRERQFLSDIESAKRLLAEAKEAEEVRIKAEREAAAARQQAATPVTPTPAAVPNTPAGTEPVRRNAEQERMANLERIRRVRQEILKNGRLLLGRTKGDGSEITKDERSQAARTLTRGGVMVDDFIRPEDEMRDPTGEQLSSRRRMVLASMIALNNGRVTEEQKKILETIGIGNFIGVEVVQNADQNRDDQNRQERRQEPVQQQVQLQNGELQGTNEIITDEKYAKLAAYALSQLFEPVNPVRYSDLFSKLNTFWTGLNGDNTNNTGYRMPLELTKRLEDELHLSSWGEVASVMNSWKELRAGDITPAGLRENLFFADGTEKLFGTLRDVPFVSGVREGRFQQHVDLALDIGMAMANIFKCFKDRAPNGRLVESDDYWPLVASPEKRISLYNTLGINQYVGEAAFAYLLSNLLLPEVGSGANSFDSLVNPINKRVAAYEINAPLDPVVRMIVQDQMIEGRGVYTRMSDEEKRSGRAEVKGLVNEMMPSRFVPVICGGSGLEALTRGDWPKWRSEHMTNSVERVPGQGEPATDRQSKLELLKAAMTLENAHKDAFKAESGLDKISAFVKAARDYSNKLQSLGFLKQEEDKYYFEGGLSLLIGAGQRNSTSEWLSTFTLKTIEVFMFTHALADYRNTNPLSMQDMIDNVDKLLIQDTQTRKYEYIGIDEDLAKNKLARSEFMEFVNKLWNKSWQVLDAANSFKSLPKWYSADGNKSPELINFAAKQKSKFRLMLNWASLLARRAWISLGDVK